MKCDVFCFSVNSDEPLDYLCGFGFSMKHSEEFSIIASPSLQIVKQQEHSGGLSGYIEKQCRGVSGSLRE